MALEQIGQLHISVTDVDKAVAFYRDTLGVPFLFRVPGQPMAFFQAGDVRLYLGEPERPEFTSKVVLYFQVTDIDAEQDRLAGLGVHFAARPHLVHRDGSTELWMSGFQDPDGHQLILMSERQAST